MKAANIKTQRQFSTADWKQYGIIAYGEYNDFPQSIHEIITASITGNSCLDRYNDFVYGMGFVEKGVGSIVVNSKGQTLSKLLRFITRDFTEYYGMAIHVNYSMSYKIRSLSFIPFENVRLCLPNDDDVIEKVAIHSDWGKRNTGKAWRKSDIEEIHIFNPDPAIIEKQVAEAGSWDSYKGQVLYFSGVQEGELSYPIPKYIAAITDMRTEEGLANVTGRNVCSNFLSAGILVDILEQDQTQEQVNEKQRELLQFQGDENTGNLWYMTAKNKEEVPVFVPFSGENYDKAFTATQAQLPDNIGQAFKQPPILRAKDVGANFGADLMTNAYKFYNSVTVRERIQLQEVLEMLFSYWFVSLESADFTIQPLTYSAGATIADRVGSDNATKIVDIITNDNLTLVQKRNTLLYVYGLTEDEVLKLIPNE